MPPLQALVALHVFWFALILPPVLAAHRALSPAGLGRLGTILLLSGLVGLLTIVLVDWLPWLLEASPFLRGYWLPRLGLAVATSTYLPAIQLVSAGLLCRMLRREKSSSPPPP